MNVELVPAIDGRLLPDVAKRSVCLLQIPFAEALVGTSTRRARTAHDRACARTDLHHQWAARLKIIQS